MLPHYLTLFPLIQACRSACHRVLSFCLWTVFQSPRVSLLSVVTGMEACGGRTIVLTVLCDCSLTSTFTPVQTLGAPPARSHFCHPEPCTLPKLISVGILVLACQDLTRLMPPATLKGGLLTFLHFLHSKTSMLTFDALLALKGKRAHLCCISYIQREACSPLLHFLHSKASVLTSVAFLALKGSMLTSLVFLLFCFLSTSRLSLSSLSGRSLCVLSDWSMPVSSPCLWTELCGIPTLCLGGMLAFHRPCSMILECFLTELYPSFKIGLLSPRIFSLQTHQDV